VCPMSPVLVPALVENSRPTQMAEAFQNLQRAISQCEEAIFFADSAGIITRVNPAFERLTEYSSLEIVGKDLSRITEGGVQSKVYQAIWRRVFEEKRFNGILNLKTKSGDWHELNLTITPIYNNRGNLVSLVGTGRPTSLPISGPQKHAPDAGTARMLHDFRNILLVVVAHADLAMDSLPSDHPARRHVENSKSAAQSAAALLHEFTRGASNWTGVPTLNSKQAQATEPLKPACALQSPSSRSERPRTILLVEDESLILSSNAEFLKTAGYEVLSAGTGGEAMDLIESYKGLIDLLVTDMVLPQVSGSDLAVAIAASHPESVVLAISGHPEEYVLRQPGIDHYLAKPFSLTDLHDKILSVLHEKKLTCGVDAVS
jgi:PAS domain S-box-containing protein